jgi:hypothetical protein
MKSNKKLIILAILLILTIGNYNRISSSDNVLTVGFLSIFAIGAISSLFLREVIVVIKNR